MKKEKKKSSGLPLSIIGLVLVLVVIGGFWFYNTSRNKATTGTNPNAAANTLAVSQQQIAANAPLGAPVGVNMLGSPNALVTVEEFADYQCGACASVHPVMKEVQSAYAGNRNFRFIFRHYPLSIPADKSYDAAVATEAAGLQGKFWQMQDQLFRNQQAWTGNPNYRDIWATYATNIGMDVEKFRTDLAGIQTKQRVDADLARGRALNVTSTPSIFINGRLVPFSDLTANSLRRLIDAEIQQASTQTQAPAATSGNANAQ